MRDSTDITDVDLWLGTDRDRIGRSSGVWLVVNRIAPTETSDGRNIRGRQLEVFSGAQCTNNYITAQLGGGRYSLELMSTDDAGASVVERRASIVFSGDPTHYRAGSVLRPIPTTPAESAGGAGETSPHMYQPPPGYLWGQPTDPAARFGWESSYRAREDHPPAAASTDASLVRDILRQRPDPALAEALSAAQKELAELRAQAEVQRKEIASAYESGRKSRDPEISTLERQIAAAGQRLETADHDHRRQLRDLADRHEADLRSTRRDIEAQVRAATEQRIAEIASARDSALDRVREIERTLAEAPGRLDAVRREGIAEGREAAADRVREAEKTAMELRAEVAELRRALEAARDQHTREMRDALDRAMNAVREARAEAAARERELHRDHDAALAVARSAHEADLTARLREQREQYDQRVADLQAQHQVALNAERRMGDLQTRVEADRARQAGEKSAKQDPATVVAEARRNAEMLGFVPRTEVAASDAATTARPDESPRNGMDRVLDLAERTMSIVMSRAAAPRPTSSAVVSEPQRPSAALPRSVAQAAPSVGEAQIRQLAEYIPALLSVPPVTAITQLDAAMRQAIAADRGGVIRRLRAAFHDAHGRSLSAEEATWVRAVAALL